LKENVMNKLVYLAGPIDGHDYDTANKWRDFFIEILAQDGITGISPLRAKSFLREHPRLVDRISKHVLTSDSGLTTRDLWDVRRSDAILFNLLGAKKISIGTMIEYGWASAFNKPIVTIMENQKNIHEHPMIRSLSGYRVPTSEEGLTIVRALFDY
jgi:nucleoside 2-deoxyribosyltransferase